MVCKLTREEFDFFCEGELLEELFNVDVGHDAIEKATTKSNKMQQVRHSKVRLSVKGQVRAKSGTM